MTLMFEYLQLYEVKIILEYLFFLSFFQKILKLQKISTTKVNPDIQIIVQFYMYLP